SGGLGLAAFCPVLLHPLRHRAATGDRHPASLAPSHGHRTIDGGRCTAALAEEIGERTANGRFLPLKLFDPCLRTQACQALQFLSRELCHSTSSSRSCIDAVRCVGSRRTAAIVSVRTRSASPTTRR